jgi:hypothetical protein
MSPNHYRHFPKFIFITRHPLATSLALESFSTTRGLSLRSRVEHWLAVEESLAADLQRPVVVTAHALATRRERETRRVANTCDGEGERCQSGDKPQQQQQQQMQMRQQTLSSERFISFRRLTLERLACHPQHELASLLTWLNLKGWSKDRVLASAKQAAKLVTNKEPNAQYSAEYARRRSSNSSFELAHAELVEEFGARVAAVDTGDVFEPYDLGHIDGAAGSCAMLRG